MSKGAQELSDVNTNTLLVAMLERMGDVLSRMQQAPKSDTSDELLARLTDSMERVAASQVQGAQIIANETRRAHRPSNEIVPGRSVFNRRGAALPDNASGPRKPVLRCDMLVPWELDADSCTREEVELANLLQQGDYTMKLTDGTRIPIRIAVQLKMDGVTPSRLLLTHTTPDGGQGSTFGKEHFRKVPPLVDMLRQILKQHSSDVAALAALVMSDEEEEALIERGQLSVAV